LVTLTPSLARMRSLAGLFTNEPLTLSYYRDSEMARWVSQRIRRHRINRMFVFSSAMAVYLPDEAADGMRVVIDFVDVDSVKWKQYAAAMRPPARWLYAREARMLLRADRRAALSVGASLFVSREEADLFRQLAPEVGNRATCIENGVDTDYFSPTKAGQSPYAPEDKVLVFTGTMDYIANVKAVRWFATQVFPTLRERVPNAVFAIVGARPTHDVLQLGQIPGVRVVGGVPNVRPYIGHAAAAVTPLQIARGVQNKILEAMAMGKEVVATPDAVNGIDLGETASVHVASDAHRFLTLCEQVLRSTPDEALAHSTREWVRERYDWDRNLGRVRWLLENGVSLGQDDRALRMPRIAAGTA